MNSDCREKYRDIIDMPHHVSTKRPHMPIRDRAAQFAPFAALTGHDAAVKETARLTEERIELDESEIAVIDEQLREIRSMIRSEGPSYPAAAITYFVPDLKKTGGSYVTEEGCIRKLDDFRGLAVMENGTEIPVKNILKIKF